MTILYFYITCFTIYFTLLALQCLRRRRKVRDKYTAKYNNMCVIVYSHNDKETLEQLVKLLKAQDYPISCFSIYVILDNCTDDSEVLLNSELNINVFNIKNMDTVGKTQAYSILVEKLSQVQGLDAFVFLDAKYYIRHDFLTDVNFFLQKHSVLSTFVEPIISQKLNTIEKIKFVYQKYITEFVSTMRAKMGLSNILNTNAFAIKKSVLDKLGFISVGDINTELEYSLNISAKGEQIFFTPELRSYSDYTNFMPQYPSMNKRFDLFGQHIKQFDFRRFNHVELIFSLIAPNWLFILSAYAILGYHIFFNDFLVDFKTVFAQFAILIISVFAGTLSAKIRNDEICYLLAYPIYSIGRLIYNFAPFIWIRALIKKITEPSTVEKMMVDVWVSDGKKNFPCKLELISNNGLSSVTFINMKNKKFTTRNDHLRMTDALNELTEKLSEYGLTLKICQCCKYYQANIDGTTNMVKGFCKYEFADRVPGDILPTTIWNTCEQYEPTNVVSLFESFNNNKK